MLKKTIIAASMSAAFAYPSFATTTLPDLQANQVGGAISVDGEASDWEGIPSITVALEGRSRVDTVELRAAVRDGRIYILAVWADDSENSKHKPLEWSETSQSYENIREKEDRLAISWLMSGEFSNDKTGGAEFEADVWHWKAERSNRAGLVHDKWWKISRTEFEGSTAFESDRGTVFVGRFSDEGDRLYSSAKPDAKRDAIMSRYDVNMNATGSIADVEARGSWKDGYWVLEMSRALDTGHSDDAVIPEAGEIEFAVAIFDNNDGKKHSTSLVYRLVTSE